jgi:hypothetical protein
MCQPFLKAECQQLGHTITINAAFQVPRTEKIEQKQQERAIEQQIERLRAQRQPCNDDGDGDASPSGMLLCHC